MVRSYYVAPDPDLRHTLASLAAAARSIPAWRQGALEALRAHVRFEAAIFHELSPRVPLARAGVIGLDLERFAATRREWDDNAVQLAPLTIRALAQGGVATDREAFGLRGPARAWWSRHVARPLGLRSAMMAHLVLDTRIVSGVLLARRADPPFSTRERETVQPLVPVLALGDGYHLARTQPSLPGVPTQVRCLDERLTARQREIVEYVALGRTNAEIGTALGISIHTVRNLLVKVCARLQAANRAEVVRLAVLHARPVIDPAA
jgi:DNA-binding CsgD family transcriptional regulator